jgi:neopullulanase
MKKTLAALLTFTAFGANAAVEHMEPPFWWAGMKHKGLQLMVHGRQIADTEPVLHYPGVRVESVTRVANRNYMFINLELDADVKPGKFDIQFKGAQPARYTYELRAREAGSANRLGFNSTDAIYQVMPDRFANGNPANDTVPGMLEKANRGFGGGRHGGDIQGIVNSLDYIASLGFTQIWPTPLVENNMPDYSYHGYAATDHYKIDARYGSNEDYVRLSKEARKRGIGIIQDVVLSHIGTGHWWMKDMPMPDWTNHGGKFVGTEHHRVSVQDPYASKADRENFTTGWFGPHMPDMNQTNPMVAQYLIQNNIWWIEYAGLSGLRIDTYGYSDKAFLTEYTRRLMQEYPRLNMVGEEWHKSPPVVSHWQAGRTNFDGYKSYLPSLMDFPMTEIMRATLADNEKNFQDVYETLSQDYLYPNPSNLVVFEGNHDVARIYSVVNEDLDLWKMDIAFIMTLPRIPQFYYGTEVLMPSTTKGRDDASYRQDFPGGWAGDKVNAYTGAGLTAKQKEAQDYVRKLVNWRKDAAVIHHGKTMHYGAERNTYVYFRYDGANKVMVAFNKDNKEQVLNAARFSEMLGGHRGGRDVVTGKAVNVTGELRLPARSVMVVELDRAQ